METTEKNKIMDKILPKRKKKLKLKIWKWSDFGGSQLPEVRVKVKNHHIFIFSFQCAPKI